VEAEFRLRLGALVAETMRTALRCWVALLVFAPVACLPMVAIRFIPLPSPGPHPDASDMFLLPLLGNWIHYCAEIATVQIWTIGIAPVVLARARGERGTFAVMPEPRAMTRGFGTAPLCLYRIASSIVLLVVPGVVQAVRLFVAVPAAIGEGLPARAAALRSAQLVRGSGIRVFWLLLLLRTVRTVLVIVHTFFMTALVRDQQLDSFATYGWLYWLIPLPFLAFEAVAAAVAYVQLRAGKETLDVAATAQVFE